jgi:hypothetical protein
MEVFSNIPREAAKRGCRRFWPRLEEVIGTKGNFMTLKQSQYPTKQFGAVSLCCCSYLSCYHQFYFHLKTGVNTPRTLYSQFEPLSRPASGELTEALPASTYLKFNPWYHRI